MRKKAGYHFRSLAPSGLPTLMIDGHVLPYPARACFSGIACKLWPRNRPRFFTDQPSRKGPEIMRVPYIHKLGNIPFPKAPCSFLGTYIDLKVSNIITPLRHLYPPAGTNYPLRYSKYHGLIETIRPFIEVHWTV